ncbi:MAG: hypothetical protein LBU89_06610 [Fibromonadaceae bacterium]|jgi:hypothetical protein|nr:hypothetical protein [Fibromonadaceae bacterium]
MKANFFRIISLTGFALALAFILNACGSGSDSYCDDCSLGGDDNFGSGVACNIPKSGCMEILAFSSDKKKEMEDLCFSLGGTAIDECSKKNVCSTELGETEGGMLYKEFLYDNSPYCRKQNSIAFNYVDIGYCNEYSGVFSDAERTAMAAVHRAEAAEAGVAINVIDECPKENIECSYNSRYGEGWNGEHFYYNGSPYCVKQNIFAFNYVDAGYCMEISGMFSDNQKIELESEYEEHAGIVVDECPKENVECSEGSEYYDGWYDKYFYYENSGYCVKQNVFAFNFIDYGYCLEISGIFNDRYKIELELEYERHAGIVLDECPKENVKCTDSYDEYEHEGYYLQRKDFNYEGSGYCGD